MLEEELKDYERCVADKAMLIVLLIAHNNSVVVAVIAQQQWWLSRSLHLIPIRA